MFWSREGRTGELAGCLGRSACPVDRVDADADRCLTCGAFERFFVRGGVTHVRCRPSTPSPIFGIWG